MSQWIECRERGDGHLLTVAESRRRGHRIRHGARASHRIAVRVEPGARIVHSREQPVRYLLERLPFGQFGRVSPPEEEPAVLDQCEVGLDDHERAAVGLPLHSRVRLRARSAGGGEALDVEWVECRTVRAARAPETPACHVGVERLEFDPEPRSGLLGGEGGQLWVRHGVLRG